jgi:hypothetical protein
LGRDKQGETQMMTPIQIVVKSLARRSEKLGYKLYTDNLSSSTDEFYVYKDAGGNMNAVIWKEKQCVYILFKNQ